MAGAFTGGLLTTVLIGLTPIVVVMGWLGAIVGATTLLFLLHIRRSSSARSSQGTTRSPTDSPPRSSWDAR